jgi:hypothetical protein
MMLSNEAGFGSVAVCGLIDIIDWITPRNRVMMDWICDFARLVFASGHTVCVKSMKSFPSTPLI